MEGAWSSWNILIGGSYIFLGTSDLDTKNSLCNTILSAWRCSAQGTKDFLRVVLGISKYLFALYSWMLLLSAFHFVDLLIRLQSRKYSSEQQCWELAGRRDEEILRHEFQFNLVYSLPTVVFRKRNFRSIQGEWRLRTNANLDNLLGHWNRVVCVLLWFIMIMWF
jgi:hypothetical protein